MRYRKIGGIHWLAIGHHRFSYCRSRRYQGMSHQWAVLSIGIGMYCLLTWSAFYY